MGLEKYCEKKMCWQKASGEDVKTMLLVFEKVQRQQYPRREYSSSEEQFGFHFLLSCF